MSGVQNPYQAPESTLGPPPPGVPSPYAKFEGYLSLCLTLPILIGPAWVPSAEDLLPHWLVTAIWLGVFVFACVFAVSGIRSNRGGSRLAALVSSTVILVYVLLILVIVFH